MDYDLLEDLPDLIDDWTNNDFLSFLKKISLEDLTDMFKSEIYDGKKFKESTENELVALGVNKIKAKKLLNWKQFIIDRINEDELVDPNKFNLEAPIAHPVIFKLLSQKDHKYDLPEIVEMKAHYFGFESSKYFDPPNCLLINDPQISSTHTEILNTKICFLIGDRRSRTGSYINIPPEKKLKLEERMKFQMGSMEFLVEEADANIIKICYSKKDVEDGKIERINVKFLNKEEIFYLGKEKVPKDKQHFKMINDETIEDFEACLSYDGENVFLEPLKSKLGVWLVLREEEESNLIYVFAEKNMIFRVGHDFYFKILEMDKNNEIPLCNTCKKKKVNSFYLPCQHMLDCHDCALDKEPDLRRCSVDPQCDCYYLSHPYRIIQLYDR